MKYLIIALTLLSINVMANTPTLAIIPFDSKGIDSTHGEVISLALIDHIPSTRYSIMSRVDMSNITNEITLNQLGMTSACDNDECLMEYGKLLQANQLITGELTLIDNTYHLTTRRLDVTSGEILASSSINNRNIEGLISDLNEISNDLVGKERISPVWKWTAFTASVFLGGYSVYSYNKSKLVYDRYSQENNSTIRATKLGEDIDYHDRNMIISGVSSLVFMTGGIVLWNF
jgi:hypothetical protein